MTDETTTDILNRLKSIEGHVRGIQRMVENGDYCIDIVNQLLAVQRAMQRVNSLVLERHLHTCVTTAIRGDDPAERRKLTIQGVRERQNVSNQQLAVSSQPSAYTRRQLAIKVKQRRPSLDQMLEPDC